MKKFLFALLIIFVFLFAGCKENKGVVENTKVSIYLSGTGIEDEVIEVEKGSTYDLPVPTRRGYAFLSWINDMEEEVTDSYIFNEDTYLSPTWKKLEMYSIYYKYGQTILKTESFYENEDYNLYEPTLEGYDFKGWYKDEGLTTLFNIERDKARTISVYAKFDAKEFTISFDKVASPITVRYKTRVGVLPKITISSCSFEGWEYNGKKIDETTVYRYTEDITLTAILKTKSTFVVGEKQNSIIYYIGDKKPYTKVIEDGYIFAGWYLDEDLSGEAIYIVDEASLAGKTLYAKFISSDDSENTYSKKLIDLVADYYISLYDNQILYESINLPSADIYYGCMMEWESSDTSAISSAGTVTRFKEDKNVTLTLNVSFGSVSREVKINTLVKKDIYKDIKNTKIVSAYVYSGTFNSRPVDDILLDTVDIINWSFAEPNSDGTIILPQDYVTKLNKFKENALNKGVRIIMTISGTHDNATDLATIASSSEARATFVDSIIEAIEKYNFAGVDIDWEYPIDSGSKFTTLMTDVYNGIKEYDKELLVTSAIPAGPFSYSKYGLKNSIKYMDYLNLMSYDMGCELMYHHTALYKSGMTYNGCSIEESVNVFKNLGVPLDKILIGAAFYGRRTTVSSFNYNSSTTQASGTVNKNGEVGVSCTYQYIYNTYLKSSSTAKVYFDNTAKASYIYDSNTKTFVTYESEKSLQEKCKYIKTKGVKGIMWWDYGSDSTGTLITALNEYLSLFK